MFRRKHASHFNSDDAEQRQAKINELRAALGPMSARGETYGNEACLRRYLEARNWNVDKSRKMLEESLKWREAYRPDDIRWVNVLFSSLHCSSDFFFKLGEVTKCSINCFLLHFSLMFRLKQKQVNCTGQVSLIEGRTVVVMRPAKQNTSSHEGQLRFLVYTLENAILSLPEGHEKMVWLIDFTGWTMANATPIKTARESANILQNHYLERLLIAFLFNPPRVFDAFWKVVKHFLDPKSIEKVRFVYMKDEESMKIMYKHIDPEVLPVEFGGKNNGVYNHEDYSKLMTNDDINTTAFWAVDAKTDHVNHVMNGHSVPKVTPQSLVAAKAS